MKNSSFEQLNTAISGVIVTHHQKSLEDRGSNLEYEEIKTIVDNMLTLMKPIFPNVSDQDRHRLLKNITDNYSVTNGERMISIGNEDAPRWLDAHKHQISWDHWNAYKKYLESLGRNEEIINENEKVIDTILDYSGDPRISSTSARKGLVMGNVQSGKTQNYLGLINKAIDAGYKTIIVLGGHLNDLRKQTQERVDEGVIGEQSIHLEEASTGPSTPIGIGNFFDNYKNSIISGTSTKKDFNKAYADQCGYKLDSGTPVIFIIKKTHWFKL